MLTNVAVVVVHDFLPFEFGVICEVFGVDRTDDGLPAYDFAVVAGEQGPLRRPDFTIHPVRLERLERGGPDRAARDRRRQRLATRRIREDLLAALRRPWIAAPGC